MKTFYSYKNRLFKQKAIFLLALIVSFTFSPICCAKSPDFYEKVFKHEKDIIKICLKQKAFEPSEHTQSEEKWKIDGVTPKGVDGSEVNPQYEIESFFIDWNGIKIPMPKELYKDCYSPSLREADAATYVGNKRKRGEGPAGEGVTLRWNEKESLLEVIMVSYEWISAPYFVTWKISSHGVYSREVVLLGS